MRWFEARPGQRRFWLVLAIALLVLAGLGGWVWQLQPAYAVAGVLDRIQRGDPVNPVTDRARALLDAVKSDEAPTSTP